MNCHMAHLIKCDNNIVLYNILYYVQYYSVHISMRDVPILIVLYLNCLNLYLYYIYYSL